MDNKFHEHSGKENKCNLKIGWKCKTIYIHCILYNSDLDMLTRALNVDSYGCVHLNVGDGPYDECNNHDPGRNQGGEQMPRRLSILESLTEHHEELGFFFLVRPHLEIKVRWHIGDFASLGGGALQGHDHCTFPMTVCHLFPSLPVFTHKSVILILL